MAKQQPPGPPSTWFACRDFIKDSRGLVNYCPRTVQIDSPPLLPAPGTD